ncbi:MAG TPA: replicative DNA helicase [Dehalococcoidia bacterium]|nr:replicative DNA helicase [Dehalococcoidia bacterium]
MVLERLPPHDIEAEEAVIASLLVDSDAILSVSAILKPDDFFREKNGWVYDACLSLWGRGEAMNEVTVSHELARRERLEPAGGHAFLSQLVSDLPTTVGVEDYARIVGRDAVYRRLISAAGRMAQAAYEGGPDLDSVLGRAETMLMALRSGEALRDFVHIRSLLESYLEPIPSAESAPSVIRTGYIDLDTQLGGLKRSDLIILAARPSMGKSALGLNFARNAAAGQHARVAIFTLEMSGEQLAQRMLASEASIDSTRLRLGEHTEIEERRRNDAIGGLSGLEIYIDDTPVLSVAEMRSKLRRLSAERGLDLVILDYLQLMHSGSSFGENRVQEISFISRSLKEMARELSVPVVALSQLSRAVESRQPHIPMLSDLRESGSIEQDADVVLFIYREDAYVQREEWQEAHPESPGRAYPAGIAQIIIAKHRNGPTGIAELRFLNRFARFEDMAPYSQ